MVSIVQNEKVSKTIIPEHISKFLLAIRNDNLCYPADITDLDKYVTVIPAIDAIGENYLVELDF